MAKKPESRSHVKSLAAVHHEPREVVKHCECGKRYSIEQWRKLKFCGAQPLDLGDVALEMRNCVGCGSTIGITVHMVPCAVARLKEHLGPPGRR